MITFDQITSEARSLIGVVNRLGGSDSLQHAKMELDRQLQAHEKVKFYYVDLRAVRQSELRVVTMIRRLIIEIRVRNPDVILKKEADAMFMNLKDYMSHRQALSGVKS